MTFTNEQKRKAVQREIGQRRWVYAKRVASGKMTQAKMDEEIAIMVEIEADYTAQVVKERLI